MFVVGDGRQVDSTEASLVTAIPGAQNVVKARPTYWDVLHVRWRLPQGGVAENGELLTLKRQRTGCVD